MRRLLRNRTTQEFLSEGRWTKDQRFGQDFPTLQQALDTCNQLQLRDMEIVLEIGPDPSHAYDVVLPILMTATLDGRPSG